MDHDLIQPRWFQPLREAIRRSIFVLVVGVPLLPVCWYATHDLPIGNLSLGLYIAVAAVLVACEYALSFHEDWGTAIKGHITDFIYVGVGSATEKATFVLCATLMASLGRTLADFFEVAFWPSQWYFGFQLLLALMIADVVTYFRHRLFHSYDPLWRFHQIHHSSSRLDWLAGSRLHLVDVVITRAVSFIPLFVAGVSEAAITGYVVLVSFQAVLIHANLNWRFGWLEWVLAPPIYHHWHHTAELGALDRNFAVHLPVIDWVFGTAHLPGCWPQTYGIEGDPIPDGWFAQFVAPFRKPAFRTESH